MYHVQSRQLHISLIDFLCNYNLKIYVWLPELYVYHAQSLDPLELELQRVVSCHVGARNQTSVLGQERWRCKLK